MVDLRRQVFMSQPRVTVTVGRGGQRTATLAPSEMYSDRIGTAGSKKRSIKDRLGGTSSNTVSTGRQISNKRQRQEDSWRRGFYRNDEDEDMMSANVQNSQQDLRYRLNQKNLFRSGHPANGSTSVVKDLREKLSGPIPSPYGGGPKVEIQRQLSSVTKGPMGVASVSSPIKVVPRFNPIQKAAIVVEEQTVGTLLQSLGLSKYLITFQAEEVDMGALRHMGDDDLKELGIPMGPRKKILLALSSHK